MKDFEKPEAWATAESAAQAVLNCLFAGKWTISIDGYRNIWIHFNPDGIQTRDSCYGSTFEEVVQDAATIGAMAVGYRWPIEPS